MADNLGSLYGAVSQKFDIGSEADFRAKMQTTEDRKKFYDAVSGKGFDLGDYNAYETRLGEVKKKEPTESTTSVSAEPVSQDTKPSEQVGTDNVLELPKSYQYNRNNKSELQVGKAYQTTPREIKRWTGDHFEKNPDASPLKSLVDFSVKGIKGIAPEAMEKLDSLPSGIGDKKANIAEAYRQTSKVQDEAAGLAMQNKLLTSFAPVQQLNQLNEEYALAPEDKKVEIQKKIDELANRPITNSDFVGTRFSKGDLNVSQNFTPTVKAGQKLEEYDGEEPSNVVPEKIKTVGDAYAKAKQNEEFIKDAQAESFTLNSITKTEQQKLLSPDQIAMIDAIPDPQAREDEFQKQLDLSKTDAAVSTSFLRGMNNTMEGLFNVGKYAGMEPKELNAEMERDYYKQQLFSVQPEGLAAKTSEGIGGMVPDMALSLVGGTPAMLASMSARHPQEALKQYYFDKFSKGETPDYNEAWKFATISTAINTSIFGGASLVGGGAMPISGTVKQAALDFLTGTVKNAAKDAAIFGLGGKAIQDLNSNAFDVEHDNNYIQAGIEMGVFGGVMYGLTHAPAIIRSKWSQAKINKAIDVSSFMPPDVTAKMIQDGQENGFITPQEATEIELRQARVRQIVNQFPKELTIEQIQEIEPLWAEKDRLSSQMKEASPVMKKILAGKISELDEKALIKGAVPLTAEEKAEYKDLITAEATEGGKTDKSRLTYLRKRMEAASTEKQSKKEADAKESSKGGDGEDAKPEAETGAENLAEGGKEEVVAEVVDPAVSEIPALKDAESTWIALGNLDIEWFDDFQNKFGQKYVTSKDVAKGYHKAKADGSNPELVKAVESLLSKEQQPSVNKGSQQRGNPALSSVESTAKALEEVAKTKPTLWEKIKEAVKNVGKKLGIISNADHINNFNTAKAEWDKLSSREKKLKRADYELDDLHHTEGGYYKVGNSLIDLDLNSNHLKLLLENNKFLNVLNKLGVTKIHGENRPAEEMFAHYSDGKIHLNNNSAFENIRQVTNAMSHELGHHEWTKLTKEERDYVRSLPLETGMAKHYEAQEKSGKGKETSASLQEENFADYVMQYFQGKLYGDEALLNKIPTKLRELFDNKYSDLLKDNEHSEIAEAYHKAKADGSNPELVKAVESLLSKEQPTPEQFMAKLMDGSLDEFVPKDLGDGVKKTIVTKRAYEGEFREGVKKELEKIGLTREIESQAEAKAKAIQFVDSVGEETALEAVRNNDVSDASGAYVWNELIERNEKKILTEKNPERIAELEAEQARLIEEFGVKATSGGRFAAALGDIYEKSDLGYNLQKKISEYKEQNGGVIPEEVEARFREYDKQLKDIKTRLAEAEQRAKEAEEKTAIANIEEEVARDKKKSRPVIYGKKRIAKGLDDLASALGAKLSVAGDEAVKVTDALSEIGRGLIEEGVATTENVWEKVKEYVADKFGDRLKDIDRYESGVRVKIADEKTTGTIKISKNLIKELVASGINNIDDLTAAVKERVKDEYPKATDREIRDAITGYGKTTNLNQDDIAVQMRKINRAGKIISSLEDIAKKKRPLKSGAQRDKLDVEERAMRKQLREAMKGLPLDEGALEEQLRTQLDASKQRVLNQIEDLEREINNGELVPKDARTVKEDAELKSLKEKRDALKKEHDAIFKDESFKEARRLELTKKANERRLEELKKKLKEGDFSKKTRKPLIADDELIKLKAEKLRIQEQYDVEFYKNKLANRTTSEKWKDRIWEIWSLPRALMATGEWSFVGVQGLKLSLSHPQYAAKAFKVAWDSMLSEKKTTKFINEIKSQEWYPTMKNSKLSLTEPHAEVTAREETFNSSWSNLVWNLIGYPTKYVSDSAYDKWIAANPMKALERASVGYLDTMRVLRFLDGMQTLREQGKTFENSPQDYKDVADMVNTFTGRASLGKAEQIAELLSKLFFSPRNWASAFKTGTPYAFYHFGKMTPTARKMAIYDYTKFVGLTTSAVALAAYGLGQDNDEETSVELDPRSIDFMKVKLGNRHIDPWGGMQQQVVFSARIVADMIADISPQYSMGGYKDYKGNIIRLGIGHKSPTKQELAMRLVVNKLGPSAALFNKYMSSHLGKHGERTDQFGNPLNASSILEESSHPIFWGTIADLYKDDPSALNGLLAFYSFFGGGVNVYQGKKKK